VKRLILGLGIAALAALIAAGLFAAWALNTTGGARWALGLAQDNVPGQLEFTGVEGTLAGGLEIGRFRFADAAFDIEADGVRVRLRPGLRPLSVQVRQLLVDSLRYRVLASDAPPGPPGPPGLPESAALPLPVDVDRLAVRRLVVEDGAGAALFEAAVEADGVSLFERLDIAQARIESDLGRIEVSGRLGLAGAWRLELDVGGELRIPLSDEAAPLRIRFDAGAEGRLEAYRLAASGEIDGELLDGAHGFTLASTGSLTGLEASELTIDGPQVSLRTAAKLGWLDLALELAGARLALPGSTLEADADLRLDLAAGTLAGDLAWRDFAWPLYEAAPRVASKAGRVTLAGTLDEWTVDGSADVRAEGAPPTELRFRASGDRDGLQAEILEGAALGGRFGGEVAYAWSGSQPLSARLTFENIGTAVLAPGWPGLLAGDVALEGQIEPFGLALDVARLSGELRGTRVDAHGRVRIGDKVFRFDGFEVAAGGSRAILNGGLYTREGLAFELRVLDPGALLPGASGSASGRGNLSRFGEQPRIRVELDGENLAWAGVRVDRLQLNNEPGSAAGRSRLEAEASGVVVDGQAIDRVALDVDWSLEDQVLEIELEREAFLLTAAARGAIENRADAPADWRWSGRLERLALSEDEQPLLALDEAATLALGVPRGRLGKACLDTTNGEARFCLEAAWDEADGVNGAVTLERLPLDLAVQRLGAGIEATQAASGELAFRAPAGGSLSATADVQLSPGMLRYVEDPNVALETGAGRIGFELAGGVLSAGHAHVPVPGQGGIELDFDVAAVENGRDAPVSGRLRAELADLDVLTLLIPAIDRMSGRLKADLSLAGTVGDPGLEGTIELADGALENLASGFRLSDLQLSGAVSADRRTWLTGQFRAVDGVGQLDALLDLTDLSEPRVTLEIGGENLVLFDTPTLQVTATPDLRLDWRAGRIEIDGTVSVPKGLVAPNVIPARTYGVSEDAVIVAGELPERRIPQSDTPLDIHGALVLKLGPGVRLKLSVAEASVSGEARFSWDGGAVPRGDGAYSLSGEILALGQLLEITDGRVSFPGVPASDPHLNIYAERDIYGNSEIRRAGVLVAGTLRRLVIEPYTDPMTNRERARTLLITGSDFNMERGTGTVDVGTYIAPKIFVSYGIGVFDQQSVFSVRYDLGRGWGVKATSGENQTGVDISYTVEN